jgi:O-antigen ligase
LNTALPTHPRRYSWLEQAAFLHAAALLLFSTWAFGGNTPWATRLIVFTLPFAALLTFLELRVRRGTGPLAYRPFACLVPWLLFNLLVAASLLHPLYRALTAEGAEVFVPVPSSWLLPGSARPGVSLPSLLRFDALFLPAFNLFVILRSRRLLRRLLLLLVANAFALSVLGTLQKLAHAPGLHFGRVASPNESFFATFIYHNHWGAFVLLSLCTAVGFLLHHAFAAAASDWRRSPVPAGLLALTCLALTAPLSTTRSCTVLVGAILLLGAVHALRLLRTPRSASRDGPPARRRFAPALAVAAVLVAFGAATVYLARPAFAPRVAQTRAQWSEYQVTGSVGARATLYRDTLHMFAQQPLFGWGLGTYGLVFDRFNTLESPDGLPQYYEDAHSDWLQAAAETGLAGLACRIAMVILPLLLLRSLRPLSLIPLYSLLGCALVVAYAWVEFPFGNVAVLFCTWFCFFAALRLAQLEAREQREQRSEAPSGL